MSLKWFALMWANWIADFLFLAYLSWWMWPMIEKYAGLILAALIIVVCLILPILEAKTIFSKRNKSPSLRETANILEIVKTIPNISQKELLKRLQDHETGI